MDTGDASSTSSSRDQKASSDYPKPDEKSSGVLHNEEPGSDSSLDQPGIATHTAATTTTASESSDFEIISNTDNNSVLDPADLAKNLVDESKKLAPELSGSFSDDIVLKWDDEDSNITDPNKNDGTDSTDNILRAIANETTIGKLSEEVTKGTEPSSSIRELILPAESLTKDLVKGSAIDNKDKGITLSNVAEIEPKLDSTDSFSEFDEEISKTESVDNLHEGDVEMSLDDVIASLDKEINNSDQEPATAYTKNIDKVDTKELGDNTIEKNEIPSNIDDKTDVAKVTQELNKIPVPIEDKMHTEVSTNSEENQNVDTLPSEVINMKDVKTTIEATDKNTNPDPQASFKSDEPNQSLESMDTNPIVTDSDIEKTKEIPTNPIEKSVDTPVTDPEPMEISDTDPSDIKEVMDTDAVTSEVITASNEVKTDVENTLETSLDTQEKDTKDSGTVKGEVRNNDEFIAVERMTDGTPTKVTNTDVFATKSDAKPVEDTPTSSDKVETDSSVENTIITSNENQQNVDNTTKNISENTEKQVETTEEYKFEIKETTLLNITSTVQEDQTLSIDKNDKASEVTLETEVTTTMDQPEPMSLDLENENVVSSFNNALEIKDNKQAITTDVDIAKTSDTMALKDNQASVLEANIIEKNNENVISTSNDTDKLVTSKNTEGIPNQNETLKDITDTNKTETQEVTMSQDIAESIETPALIIEKTFDTEIPNAETKVDSAKIMLTPTETLPTSAKQTESESKITKTIESDSEFSKTIKESAVENLSETIEPMSITEYEETIQKHDKTVENMSITPETVSTPSSSDEIPTIPEKEPVSTENIPLSSENIPISTEKPIVSENEPVTSKDNASTAETIQLTTSDKEMIASENLPSTAENIASTSETIKQTSETILPISESIQLISETIQPTSETIQTASETMKPTAETIQPSSETKQPTSETIQPTSEIIQPTSETIQPTSETKQPTSETIQPTSEIIQPTSETIQPTSETIQTTSETIQPISETIQPTSETIQSTSETIPSTYENLLIHSETIKPISETIQPISETTQPNSETIQTTSETKQPTSETLQSTSETLPTTKTTDQMAPDASDEIPEVTDSLGLLAESFRSMDDLDQDDEPVDDDDEGEDDDDDDDDNQTPLEHSEDSNNAQSSETDQPKELIEAPDSVIETEAVIDVPMQNTDEIMDTNILEEVLPKIETVLTVARTDELSKENIDCDKGTKMSEENSTNVLKNLLENEKSTEITKPVAESPSKTKKLEISQPNVFMNFVDLEESSSEDDIQVQETKDKTTEQTKSETKEVSPQKEKEKQVTINLPKEIEVMSTAVGSPSSIVSKEGEVEISGIPKPVVAKVARLNTDEITIKTAKDSEPSLVIPEAKLETEVMTKAQVANELNQEIFNLDSDEDKEKENELKSKLDRKPKEVDHCINPLCDNDHETTPKVVADPTVIRFYKVKKSSKKKKQPAMVCVLCANVVALRMENLLEGVKSLRPLLELDIDKSVQEFVEISDSETDSDGEGKEAIGKDAVKFLEAGLEDMINRSWKQYNLDERMQLAKEQIEIEVDELEKDTKLISAMLNECQEATDDMRRQFYSHFTRRIEKVKPLVIVDTPTVKYSHLVEEEDVLPAPLNRSVKRSKSFVDEPPSKRVAGTWGPIKQEEPETTMDTKEDDNTEVKVVKLSVESAPSSLPPVGELVRPPVKNGDMVLAARNTQSNWTKARIEFVLPKLSGTPFTQCRVRFEHKVKAQVKVLQCRHIAYYEPANVRLAIGTRIIALFKDPTNPQKKDVFYSGVVAEGPNPMNKYRYLVFFDDGYAQYVKHENTRVVTESSTLVWDEVSPLSREFVRNYLLAYPERPMVRLHAGQRLKTEWNGKWWLSKVIKVDASLVHVHFEADNRYEWIYRGSTRLAPLYLELQAAERHRNRALHRSTGNNKARVNMPYVEYTRTDETSKEDMERERREQEQEEIRRQRAVAKKSTAVPNQPMAPTDTAVMSRVVYYTPKAAVRPHKMSTHTCSPKCKRTDVLPLRELRTYNPLARPLLSGWERQIVRFRFRREVMYRAPCGRRVRSMAELHRYLLATCSDMSVDLFDFGVNTHCLAEFVLNRCLVSKKDLSHGKENVPVPCVNYYDASLPEFCSYNTERTPTAGVPLNLDPEFLCGCDCTDDCRDKTKCACWKLTLEGARTIGMDDDVGYVYRRLQDPVPSGIYECNSRCKCKSTCLNRVAQHPLQLKLQVFKTQNRGWGIRALNDVPKGGFLCIYAGNLLTDATANLDGLNEGDEYLAELDYIEVVEQMKEGFEADIPDKDKELDRKSSSKSSSEESEESEEEEAEERDKASDGDFKPDVEPGVALFSKRLRRRNKKKEEVEPPKEKSEDDCITISDDEELREPSRFMAQAGMGANQFISKYKSVRQHFGEDEACYIMDAKVQGNIGRYLNHSCTPNVFVQNVFVDTHDPRFPWVAFFALSHVKAGTELTWNYNYDIGSVPGKVLYCYCGALNCRGRLL